MVPFTIDLAVAPFGPITCSGNACVADVLQYTVYAVIIPLVWMGGVQAIAISLGEVVTGAIEILDGAVGTVQGNKVYKLH